MDYDSHYMDFLQNRVGANRTFVPLGIHRLLQTCMKSHKVSETTILADTHAVLASVILAAGPPWKVVWDHLPRATLSMQDRSKAVQGRGRSHRSLKVVII